MQQMGYGVKDHLKPASERSGFKVNKALGWVDIKRLDLIEPLKPGILGQFKAETIVGRKLVEGKKPWGVIGKVDSLNRMIKQGHTELLSPGVSTHHATTVI